MLKLAGARKPLPVDYPIAALAYRAKDLAALRTWSTGSDDDLRRTTPSTGRALGPLILTCHLKCI